VTNLAWNDVERQASIFCLERCGTKWNAILRRASSGAPFQRKLQSGTMERKQRSVPLLSLGESGRNDATSFHTVIYCSKGFKTKERRHPLGGYHALGMVAPETAALPKMLLCQVRKTSFQGGHNPSGTVQAFFQSLWKPRPSIRPQRREMQLGGLGGTSKPFPETLGKPRALACAENNLGGG
jgi:hypothetical protein